MKKVIIMGFCLWAFAGVSEAKSLRATELSSSSWSNLAALGDVTIEFRQGDELPVSLKAEGDLMETTRPAISYVGIKKDFWLKVQQSKVLFSLDGVNYKEFSDALTGSFTAGAGTGENGGIANTIEVALKAYLK